MTPPPAGKRGALGAIERAATPPLCLLGVGLDQACDPIGQLVRKTVEHPRGRGSQPGQLPFRELSRCGDAALTQRGCARRPLEEVPDLAIADASHRRHRTVEPVALPQYAD